MPGVELLGVSITPADCYPEAALETTRKLLHLLNQSQVPVSVGQYHGINAFPSAWRAQPRMLNAFPTLLTLPAEPGHVDPRPSAEVLRAQLAAATQPVTVLLTGPCSTLVQALVPDPSLASRIGQVVWMGGAVDVPGNVRTYNQNGTAEWNVFWDPVAAQQMLTFGLPLTLIPLDVTNQVPVSLAFLRRLAEPTGGAVLGYYHRHHPDLRVHLLYVGRAGNELPSHPRSLHGRNRRARHHPHRGQRGPHRAPARLRPMGASGQARRYRCLLYVSTSAVWSHREPSYGEMSLAHLPHPRPLSLGRGEPIVNRS
jgi:hypothetical protein